MNFEDLKFKYKEIVDHTFKNSYFKTYQYENVDNLRENKWRESIPAIYVIGPENNINHIVEEATREGFINLIKFLHPKMMTETVKEIEGCEEFNNWMTQKTRLICFGCHLSHVIIAKDIIENNHDYALVLENDCKFERSISNSVLDEIKNIYNINKTKISYLNLGNSKDGELFYKSENIEIVRAQTFLTHSYIINKSTAEILYETIDINKKRPERNFMGKKWDHEQFYRAGADDFFTCYVDSFTLRKGFTYQQFIGDNRVIRHI